MAIAGLANLAAASAAHGHGPVGLVPDFGDPDKGWLQAAGWGYPGELFALAPTAMDSPEKRRAASGVPFLPLGPGVTPNGAKDVEWRAQAAWGYSGIAGFSATASAPFVYRRRRRLKARKRSFAS